MQTARILLTLSLSLSLSVSLSLSRLLTLYAPNYKPSGDVFVGVHKRTSIRSSFFILQLCPVCFPRLTQIVCEMESKQPMSYYFVRCCFQDFFKRARSIFVEFLSNLFSKKVFLWCSNTLSWHRLQIESIHNKR